MLNIQNNALVFIYHSEEKQIGNLISFSEEREIVLAQQIKIIIFSGEDICV